MRLRDGPEVHFAVMWAKRWAPWRVRGGTRGAVGEAVGQAVCEALGAGWVQPCVMGCLASWRGGQSPDFSQAPRTLVGAAVGASLGVTCGVGPSSGRS